MTAVIPPLAAGLVLGLLSHAVLPPHQRDGVLLSALLGVAGALLASYTGASLGWYAPGQWGDWLASWVGAVTLRVLATRGRPSLLP